jgi:hypothetical protein
LLLKKYIMKDTDTFTTIKQHACATYLLLAILLCLTGCSATLPTVTPDSSVNCSTFTGEPPQNAPDDCRKEICVDGSLTSIEDLTETAPVSDWAEETFCFFHPIDCIGALSVKKHVRKWEQDMVNAGFWDRASLQSGLGDAARHAYLGCMLSEQFGNKFAKDLLDAHEEDSSVMFGFGTRTGGNRCCDKLMDLYNNQIGMELAGQTGTCEKKVMNSLHRLRHSLCIK